jgi:hypothetical protein
VYILALVRSIKKESLVCKDSLVRETGLEMVVVSLFKEIEAFQRINGLDQIGKIGDRPAIA